jgi:hypothetical protein
LFLFGLLGAVCGLIASVVYGVFRIEQTPCEPVPCGWSVLGLVLSSAWLALGLLAAVGVVLGAVGGVTAAWLTRGRQAQTEIRTWNLVIGATVLVVAAATTLLILNRRQPDPVPGGELATVIVSKKAIPANQLLDPLIKKGVIVEIDVPRAALEDGALTDVDQLRGRTAISLIRRHEQISAANLAQVDAPA